MLKEKKNAAIVLAAGQSKRLQTPKQLLKWKGTTLLNHTINELSLVFENDIIVVLGAYATEIAKSIKAKNANVIYNSHWQEGMGKSIACGMQKVLENVYDGVLITLCDMPYLNAADYKKLLKEFNDDEIVATNRLGKPGVPALFPKSHFKTLSGLSKDVGAKHLMQKATTKIIKIENALFDVDTKEDYKQLISTNQ